METMKIRLTFTEEVLGLSPNDPEIAANFTASKAPDAPSREEEIEALGVEEVIEKGKTVFPRENDRPFIWDYQVKGMFKDICGMLARAKGTKSSALKAYKKIIDGLIFPAPRKIMIDMNGGSMGECQRPVRINSAKGERVALLNSETVPAGSTVDLEIKWLETEKNPKIRDLLAEWLDYGALRGFSQWRNSGKGTFLWEVVK